MEKDVVKFSEDQWAFLAVLEAFGRMVSIELAGILQPLFPGPLIELLTKAEAQGWIKRIGGDHLSLTENLPDEVRKKLKKINNTDRLTMLLDRLETEKSDRAIDLQAMIRLNKKAGRLTETGKLEIQAAQQAIEDNNHQSARNYLKSAVSHLEVAGDGLESDALFVAATMQLSSISLAQGKDLSEIEEYLRLSHDAADRLGDRRSRAMINLHIGGLYYFTDRRDDALVALSLGTEEIEELGDSDIRSQSDVFLGIFYFIKGLFKESIEHLERAKQQSETSEGSVLENPMIPIFFGYCAAYLGQFHRAIGSLDFKYRQSMERSDKALASTLQAILGTVLLLLKKPSEASNHLNQAHKRAKEINNAIGLYFCGGGIALQFYLDGRMDRAYEVLKKTMIEGSRAGLVRQFASPWVLEMLYEFYRLGFDSIPDFDFSDVLERILNGVNIHLQGVALRLRAKDNLSRRGLDPSIAEDLKQSEKLLRQSGDPVQLSKTLFQMARIELINSNLEKARQIIQKARHHLGGYVEEFFPNELQHLVEDQTGLLDTTDPKEQFIDRYLGMLESLYPSESRTEVIAKMLTATSRMFGAERSGIFWFPSSRFMNIPELRAVSNLSRIEITSNSFKPSLAMVHKAFKTNKPLSDTIQVHESVLGKKRIRSVLCIPIEVKGLVYGVMYYDNSYLDNAFNFLDLSMVKRMMRHTNTVVERRFNHIKMKEKVILLSSEKSLRYEHYKGEIITRSDKMIRLLSQVEQIAETKSTVLIQGETGTGKELIANHIHNQSLLADAPFIIVDSTTIPEYLLESELFGHEKGAFTGADKRKIGRIELANQGTLFLDEVGELTLQAQVKLLRVLQEKTFNRVGGTRTITSYFRLIAATNRDLAGEVVKGRFREDLYYRLNVVPIIIPPLRERGEDAVLLAKHFIERYAKKYNRTVFQLSPEDENRAKEYTWPGNVRELKNIVERAVILSHENRLDLNLSDLHPPVQSDPFSDKPTLDEIQRRYIKYTIESTGGKISGPGGAAEVLGLKRTSLYSRMKALKIKR